ncbi:MAG TPA: DUF3109 family protein [Bacteroidales bacterium]|nr:DUF3109 family protein [Bacteroidales bacterium]HPS17546.1 DUF3109 family protein [Bacteroidales bacterium]
MIIIENTLVSENIVDKKFVCDLSKCKGECCVAGDAGAPLEESELPILEELYPYYKEYLTPEGIKAIKKHGFFVVDDDKEFLTPMVSKEKYCAYVYYDGDIAKCAIEKAFFEGKIKFRKPISCHLYPVRITQLRDVDAVNYHQWDICKCACELGEKKNVPVFRFLEEPLKRKYGEEWYRALEAAENLRKL